MPARRFSPPWIVEELDACFVVRDNNEQALSYVYYESEPGRRSAAKLLSKDEARRIAANIAKLPALLQKLGGGPTQNELASRSVECDVGLATRRGGDICSISTRTRRSTMPGRLSSSQTLSIGCSISRTRSSSVRELFTRTVCASALKAACTALLTSREMSCPRCSPISGISAAWAMRYSLSLFQFPRRNLRLYELTGR
jgi:hypothetical protein